MATLKLCLGIAVLLMGAGFVSAIYSLICNNRKFIFASYGLGIIAGLVAAAGIVAVAI